MSMTFGDLVTMVRQDYVDALLLAEETLRAEGGTVTAEAPLVNAAGEVVRAGELALPARLDLVATVGDKVQRVRVQAEGVFQFEGAIKLALDEVVVEVRPFRWEALQFDLLDLKDDFSFEPLQNWFNYYFMEEVPDEDEAEVPPELGVVHGLSDPLPQGNGHRLVADLGTAPPEALEDLLEACAACGAGKIMVAAAA